MNNPFFSVIIPTYNRGDLITLAINSVLNQTFQDFEIIIVDDGSTDNTEEIVGNIRDERIRYFKKENEERSIARNFGVDKAEGKYINFLDADDLQYENHLEVAYSNISLSTEILHLGFEIIETSGKVVYQENNFDNLTIINLLNDNPIHCNAIFIKNEIIKENKFLHDRKATFAEDWYLWIILASKYKFEFINTITSCIVEHENRSLSNLNTKKLIDSIDIIVYHLNINKNVISKFSRKDLSYFTYNRYIFISYTALIQKDYFIFLRSLLKALRNEPKKTLVRLYKKVRNKDE